MISGHAIPHHLYVDDSQLYVSLHQGTLLQRWMVYSHVWPLSSHGCQRLNWNWTQLKLNSSLSWASDSGTNTSLGFLSSFSVSKTDSAKSARNLGVIFDNNFTFHSHISAVCSSCCYHRRDLQRIRRHLDLDSAKLLATAPVTSHLDYCNSLLYGITDTDLPNLRRVQNLLARLVTRPSPFTHSVPLLRSLYWLNLEYWWRSFCWSIKCFMQNRLFIVTPYLPRHSHPVHWYQTKELVCRSLVSRPTQMQELFMRVLCLFGTTSFCLSVQPFQLLPSKNIWRHISLTCPFPHRHRHARWPVDVYELLYRFCCWTVIGLSRQWAWLGRKYGRHRNFIDWLISDIKPIIYICIILSIWCEIKLL